MKPILVIGGGISGISAALEMAEAGKEVILLEKEAYLGGNVVKMNNYFPKLCPPACGMEINYRRIKNNPRIKVMTSSEVKQIEGKKGNMKVSVRTFPSFVTDLCTSCGECVEVCPESRPDLYNLSLGTTRAIYLPHAHAFPQKYTIDNELCLGASCAKCVAKCQYDAIHLDSKEEETEIEVHSILLASGWKSYNAELLEGFNYSTSPDIVTNMEFERILSLSGPSAGKLLRPSNEKPPSSIAIVHCAGSRDRKHLPYCSAVCCSASLKHALNAASMLPELELSLFYIDLRVSGRNEDFLKKVEKEERISLVKGKVAGITVDDETKQLEVSVEDILAGKKMKKRFDMVVLATGLVPQNDIPGLNLNEYGFALDAADSGIYAAGSIKKPMDVSASVKDASGAALAAMK